MKDYTITLTKILGKDKYEKLVDFTFESIQKKFGNIRADRAAKIAKINHQSLMIVSIFKAKKYENQDIIKILHWDKKKAYRFIVTNSYEQFILLYEEYISLIIKFIENPNFFVK